MSRCLWIASYPKSGNTWVRFIVTDLLRGPVRHSAAIEGFIRDVHRRDHQPVRPGYRDTLLYKTHLHPDRLGEAALDSTAGAIYVVRNPFDVFASSLHYTQVPDAERRQALELFVRHRGVPVWQQRGMGSLSENVAGWLDPSLRFPRLVLRYEDLSAAPLAAVARLCRFLGHEAAPEAIAATVARTSFAALRAMEGGELSRAEPGFFATERAHSPDPHRRFLNRGRVGTYRDRLSPTEIDAIADAFAEPMAAPGYGLNPDRSLRLRAEVPARGRLEAEPAFRPLQRRKRPAARPPRPMP